MIPLARLSLLCVVFFVCQEASAQIPDSVKSYIDSALYFMEAKSLFANNINWPQTKDSVYSKAHGAKTYQEAGPAIAYAFYQLKDYHGIFANEDTSYRYPAPINFEEALSKGIKAAFLKGPRIATHYFDGSIAYLRVPSMNVFTQADIDKRANMLRDSLCMLFLKKPKQLILDLRMNSGGNAAPMITGLSPLFKDSLLGFGVDRNGNFLQPTKLKEGVLLDETGNKLVQIGSPCAEQVNLPVAVLIGPSTISSGEILTVYLKQQKNVRVFGEATPGFCNATEGFLFMNNNGYLLLSVNKIADGKKKVYTDMFVKPDVYIKSDDNYDNLLADPTVIAAMKWLKSVSLGDPNRN